MEQIDLHGLTPREVNVVKDLIRSLKRDARQQPKSNVKRPRFSFNEARKALSGIKGNISDTVSQERESYS